MIKKLLSILGDSNNSFEGQEEGEEVKLLLRQHPFVIYVQMGILLLSSIIPLIIGAQFWNYFSAHGSGKLFLFVASLWYLGVWLTLFRALTIYTLNILIITDRRIITNKQHAFFDREISELRSHRIQDVTTHTNGFIETILKFGDISVQTAASEREFIFRKMPQPDEVRNTIMKMSGHPHHSDKKDTQSKGTVENLDD